MNDDGAHHAGRALCANKQGLTLAAHGRRAHTCDVLTMLQKTTTCDQLDKRPHLTHSVPAADSASITQNTPISKRAPRSAQCTVHRTTQYTVHRTQYTACSFARSSPSSRISPDSALALIGFCFFVPAHLRAQKSLVPIAPSPAEPARACSRLAPVQPSSCFACSAVSALSALSPDCPLSRKSGDREFCGAPPHECQ
jgi:hypothetical protein